MSVMSLKEYEIFYRLTQLTQKGLITSIEQFLKNRYEKVVKTDSYIYAIGDIPITLVAHLDTVFSKPPSEIFYDINKNVIWGVGGLGADDRAGVYAILKLINSIKKPHIIFTTDEEKGSIGAKQLVNDVPTPFADMRYIVELDRQGSKDCVFYQCDNPDFTNYISSFGFEENFGTFSDISEICPAWEIAGVNLSIGYKDEHSLIERLYIDDMFNTIDKVNRMIEDIPNLKENFKYIPINPKTFYQKYVISSPWYDGSLIECHRCHKDFSDYEMFYVQELSGEYNFWCPNCISNNINWCSRCGEPFESYNEEIKMCIDCEREKENANVQSEH